MNDPTASALAEALRNCPAAHIDLRAHLVPPSPARSALAYVKIYGPCDRHAVARSLVLRQGFSQELAFRVIAELIDYRYLIECDGALIIPSAEVHPSERMPLWPVVIYALSIIAIGITIAVGLARCWGWL